MASGLRNATDTVQPGVVHHRSESSHQKHLMQSESRVSILSQTNPSNTGKLDRCFTAWLFFVFLQIRPQQLPDVPDLARPASHRCPNTILNRYCFTLTELLPRPRTGDKYLSSVPLIRGRSETCASRASCLSSRLRSKLRVHSSSSSTSGESLTASPQEHCCLTPSHLSNKSNPPAPSLSLSHQKPEYSFDWAVKDDYAALDFGQHETRDGYNTDGSYYVLLPDGRVQKVTYTVHGDGGYVATVEYEGEVKHDAYGKPPAPVYTQPPTYGPPPTPAYGNA
ncbi:hypothetical protein O3P69_014616 [Scylla paramamosain]|uniref:Pro-resilin n=1 Tax=Scylla paramamosain TaxID=85552 RepID=A0AAW0U0G1_SCYPA